MLREGRVCRTIITYFSAPHPAIRRTTEGIVPTKAREVGLSGLGRLGTENSLSRAGYVTLRRVGGSQEEVTDPGSVNGASHVLF